MNVFKAEEIGKYHLIAKTGKNKIGCEPYEFNPVFIIAMDFRIDLENADVLRKWIVNKMFRETVALLIPTMNILNYGLN